MLDQTTIDDTCSIKPIPADLLSIIQDSKKEQFTKLGKCEGFEYKIYQEAIIKIEEDIIVGFDKDLIEKLLKKINSDFY